MTSRRETKRSVGMPGPEEMDYDTLVREYTELGLEEDRLEEAEKTWKEAGKKQHTQRLRRGDERTSQMRQARLETVRKRRERLKLSIEKAEMERASTPGPEGQVEEKPKDTSSVSPEGSTVESTEAATAAPKADPYAEATGPSAAEQGLQKEGITGGAGTQPGGDYDINIGIGEGGEIVAPQGLTPEQLAIMVPGAFGAATPGQVKDAAERPSMPTAPPGGRPPKDFSPTDYSPEGRRRFETQVMSQIGFNPITFNPMDYVNKAMTQLPALFNHVFDGKIMWADRNKLDKKQLSHWMNVVKMFRADKLREGNEQQEIGLRQYNYMMNRFDKEAAVKQKNLEAMRKAPKTMSFWDAEKGAMVMHEYKNGQWVPSDKITSEPKESEKKAAEKKERMSYEDAWAIVKFFAKYETEDPTDADDANAKLNEVMRMMGQGEGFKTKSQERLYRRALERVMEEWGLEPEVTGAKPEMKFDNKGNRIQ